MANPSVIWTSPITTSLYTLQTDKVRGIEEQIQFMLGQIFIMQSTPILAIPELDFAYLSKDSSE